jgi:membrane-associated phospholipid phosphatase
LPTAEWIQVIFVCALAMLAYLRPLAGVRRTRIGLLAGLALAIIATARFAEYWIPPFTASILRDWVPALVLLIPYWQVGQFFTGPDLAAESRLAAFDRKVFWRLGIEPAHTRIPSSLSTYLELAYFSVYPLVPVGVVVLYVCGRRDQIDFYWVVVLAATYVCYSFTLGIRARPPRALAAAERFQMPKTPLRIINRDILDHASIQAITCPSAHVSSALAAALVILHVHTWAGAVFCWLALSIALATVVGGYHYLADVLSAVIVALLVFTILRFA